MVIAAEKLCLRTGFKRHSSRKRKSWMIDDFRTSSIGIVCLYVDVASDR